MFYRNQFQKSPEENMAHINRLNKAQRGAAKQFNTYGTNPIIGVNVNILGKDAFICVTYHNGVQKHAQIGPRGAIKDISFGKIDFAD